MDHVFKNPSRIDPNMEEGKKYKQLFPHTFFSFWKVMVRLTHSLSWNLFFPEDIEYLRQSRTSECYNVLTRETLCINVAWNISLKETAISMIMSWHFMKERDQMCLV